MKDGGHSFSDRTRTARERTGGMEDYTMFRQALRGFDKDEVLAYITRHEEESAARIADLEKNVKKRDKIISELKNRIVLKDEQVDRMEKEIRNKYQKYIDNYNQIGELVYESKLKADRIVAEAHIEADRILAGADAEAKRRVASVQGEVDAKLNDGKQKYIAVQDEMNEIVDLFNQMQKKFMQSYKEVHEIIQSMPASLDDMDLDFGLDEDGEEDLDEADLDLSSLGIDFDDEEDFDDYDELTDDMVDDLASLSAMDGADSETVRETAKAAVADAFEGTDALDLLDGGKEEA